LITAPGGPVIHSMSANQPRPPKPKPKGTSMLYPERAKRVEGTTTNLQAAQHIDQVSALVPFSGALQAPQITPISPRFPNAKPAKTLQKPAKNPHFAPTRRMPIFTSTPYPINPYIRPLSQRRVQATFFPTPATNPTRPMHETARKCTVSAKCEFSPAHFTTQPRAGAKRTHRPASTTILHPPSSIFHPRLQSRPSVAPSFPPLAPSPLQP
ncbi:MAG: hypothetical protein JWN40_1706, partial [Phycisphaerales bacterium]|nr:hypothetical protein [Phycisphaerales bacterium]